MKSSDALSSLKDIEGVYGSFGGDGSGALTLRDLAAVIDNDALREPGPRIARLRGAMSYAVLWQKLAATIGGSS